MTHLKTDALVKYFGEKKVVDQISLDVERGEVVGLLGPNDGWPLSPRERERVSGWPEYHGVPHVSQGAHGDYLSTAGDLHIQEADG